MVSRTCFGSACAGRGNVRGSGIASNRASTQDLRNRAPIRTLYSETVHQGHANRTTKNGPGDERASPHVSVLHLADARIALGQAEGVRNVVHVAVQIETLGDGEARAH